MKKNKQTISSGDNSTNLQAGGDIKLFIDANFPKEFVDQKIEEEVDRIRKSRFFLEFNRIRSALILGKRLSDGNLSKGTEKVRGFGLSWCARVLSRSDKLEKAKEFLEIAKEFSDTPEIIIAEAFIISQSGDMANALKTLSCLDTPSSRSACLMIVAHHEGAEGGINWFNDVGLNVQDLDSDGKYFLLVSQLELKQWDAGFQIVSTLNKADFDKTPVLHHFAGKVKLLKAVPDEFRTDVLSRVPFESYNFRLISDSDAMGALRESHGHFVDAVEIAKIMECPDFEQINDEFALWLELKDPDTTKATNGKKRLKSKLHEIRSALNFVPLALQFGIKLDLDTVEREINRQVIMNGKMTIETALARFALVFKQKTPEEAVTYLTRHYDQLSSYIDAKLMQCFQVEMYSKAGITDKAKECFNKLVELGISNDDQNRLRYIIAEAQGENPINALKDQYNASKGLRDLILLVDELEINQNWNELSEYADLLFKKTNSLKDAEKLVQAFSNLNKSKDIIEFLDANSHFLSQSKRMKMAYAWSLYNEGKLIDSRKILLTLNDESESQNYRALYVNLCVTTGDWASLSDYVSNEYQNRDSREAYDLLSVAQLSFNIGSPYVKEFIRAAVAKAGEDPAILSSAYFLSSTAGWEDDPEVHNWLEKAAVLSGTDGPIKRMSLKEIIEQKPEWDQNESTILRMLERIEIPIFFAAKSLNRTLIDLTVFPALANLSENDPRRRIVIPSFNGNRKNNLIDIPGKKFAIDATALLTLSFLKILDKTLDSLDTVYIPHSTLGWLFEERQKVAYHQPSQIQKAHKLRDLLATEMIEKFIPSTEASSDLAAQIGEELAALIAEAEKFREDDNKQRIVVRSAPVHRISNFMQEDADLSAHAPVLSSCLAVVEKLKHKGQITAEEEKRGRSYLLLHEKPWPVQPEISDEAILYLDGLSTTFFLDLGMLEKIKAAGFRTVVSTEKISQANALISYERISSEVEDIVERIRDSLNKRIVSGQIKVGRISDLEDTPKKSLHQHPSLNIIGFSPICDALIVDDRFINQHMGFEDSTTRTPILSTLDLMDSLVSLGVLSDNELIEYRTRLRRAGYLFIPLVDAELERFLDESNVVKETISETAELKAVRDSILRARMSQWLQMPKENYWLDTTTKTFIRALRNSWVKEKNIDKVLARSNWLINQIDVRGWAHSLGPEIGDNLIRTGRGEFIYLLISPPFNETFDKNQAYWTWLEEKILVPIKTQFPDLYSWIVERSRYKFGELVKVEIPGEEKTPYVQAAIYQTALNFLPPLIRESLLEDFEFRREYDFKSDAVYTFAKFGLSINRSKFFEAIRVVLSGSSEVTVIDENGCDWCLRSDFDKTDEPKIILSTGEHTLQLPNYAELSQNVSIRIKSFDKSVNDVNLPNITQDKWRNILLERTLEDDEIEMLQNDIIETPVCVERSIQDIMKSSTIKVSSLVPSSLRYYERLVGAYDGSSTIWEYASAAAQNFFKQLAEWRPFEGFLFSLFLSSHDAVTAEISIDHLDRDKLIKAYDFIESHGDILSKLGAIEVGLQNFQKRPEIEQHLIRLVSFIRDDDVESSTSAFKLFSALFVLVDGELSKTRLMVNYPPFYRRLASMAQAALIQRQFVHFDIDHEHFSKFAQNNRGEYFYMQSLADMRIEPHWHPEFIAGHQMKSDFFGRMMNAGTRFKNSFNGSELQNLILGESANSLPVLSEFPYPFLPGPLEGTRKSPNTIPPDLAKQIESKLDTDEAEPSSFIALLNSAMLYRVTSDQAQLATKVLKLANYRIKNIEDTSQFLNILSGLAIVAAVSRSHDLAAELRILVRRYRHDIQYGFSMDFAINICLVASAAFEDLIEWRNFLGEWLTELAFDEMKKEEAHVLNSRLGTLLNLVPELWYSCGRADSSLKAFLSI